MKKKRKMVKIRYVFDHESVKRLLSFNNYQLNNPTDIVDYYLTEQTRIRFETSIASKQTSYSLQFEESVKLSADVAKPLISQAKLVIEKRRFKVRIHSYLWIDVTVDFVERPLKVAIIECEVFSDQVIPPLHQILGYRFPLSPCPLSTWDYFCRRIGICGAPLSGKSEVSRFFATTINTVFGGRAFPVQEYATSFIQKYGYNPSFIEQFLIYEGQLARELNAAKRSDIVISDCPTFLSYIYASLHKKDAFCLVNCLILSKLYKRVLFDLQNYTDIVFLRFQQHCEDEVTAELIDSKIAVFLQDHNVFHTEAHCEDWECVLRKLFYLNAVVGVESEQN